jgi:hypothetical protein
MRQVLAFVIALCVIPLVSCVSLGDLKKQDTFDDITRAYGGSMRWSDFDAAVLFVRQPGIPGMDVLKNIKITTYEVKHHLVVQEGARVRQVASIAYFKKSDMLLRSISVEEVWEFFEEDGAWYLTKGFPEFK